MTVDELAKAQNLLVKPFDCFCHIEGCLNVAEHLATFTQGKRVQECQLCNRHYRELAKRLTSTGKDNSA